MGSLYYKARAHMHVRTSVYEIKWKEHFSFAPKYSRIHSEFISNSEGVNIHQIQISIPQPKFIKCSAGTESIC